MAHTIYENFVLENKIENFLKTNIDINNYVTADYTLAENAGMTKKVHIYTATGNVEDLAMGEGNTGDINASFTEKEYKVGTTQGRFPYFDEEEETDPMVVEVGIEKLTKEMTNDLTTKAIAELGKTELEKECDFTFEGIVDAIAMYPYEDEQGLFLLINPAEKAELRKNLGAELKYVEDFVRTGYIGTVCGVPVIVSKAVPAGEAYLATKDAVTVFVKKGVEIEQDRDANTRKNVIYARKVMLVALTDGTRAIKLVKQA